MSALRSISCCLFAFTFALTSAGSGEPDYPKAVRSEHVDTYHGKRVPDPYRWMEGDSEKTRQWIEAQVGLFDDYVAGVGAVTEIRDRIRQIRDFDRYGVPVRRGDRYLYVDTPAGAKHGTLFMQKGLDGTPRKWIDFAAEIEDEENGSGGFVPSPDGRYVVWSEQSPTAWGWLSITGPDGKSRPAERLEGIGSSSAIWSHDSRGFYYTRYGSYRALVEKTAEPRAEIYYHRLGTPQAEDRLVYGREDRPSMLFSPKLSDDGRYLVVGLFEGTANENRVVYKDVRKPDSEFVTLIDTADAAYTFEGNVGRRFFFQTTLGAPKGRLVAVDLDRPERKHWKTLIPERDYPLNAVSRIGERLVVRWTRDARPHVELFKTTGERERELELPGGAGLFGFRDDPASSTSFFGANSLYDPGTIYRVDLTTGKSRVHRRPTLTYDPDDFVTEQVFYRSADGTRIPMFIAHKKGLKRDGKNPTFMYGYGHGGWVAFPWYQPHLVAWLEMGGVYALPGLRGGGEYGADWQEAGTRRNKQNTIDDFIAATEWLIEKRYTSPRRMVANGGSASGVLAAAAVVQRPDLYGAALVEWPFLDMYRYHEFTRFQGWTTGYGSSSDAADFAVLSRYSPLHNLKPDRCYPAVLTIVGEKDQATVPMHGYKFTAALQADRECDRPYLMKFIPGGGHYSYGSNPEESVEAQAEVLAFLIRALALEQPRGKP